MVVMCGRRLVEFLSMICSVRTSIIPLPKPKTFAGLMEIYEINYINLRRLCGNLRNIDNAVISEIQQDMDLHLTVIYRSKYTITIKLTYQFLSQDSAHSIDYPDLLVRIYFDAKQAEVLNVSKCSPSALSESHSPYSNQLSEKWQPNRFLYKWLKYYINQGYTFKTERLTVDK